MNYLPGMPLFVVLARESAKQPSGSNATAGGNSVPTINTSIPSTTIKKKPAAAPVVVRAKRKAGDKKPKKQPSSGDKKQKVDDEDDAAAQEKTSEAPAAAKPAVAIMGLVAYGSDSDSE
jgi:hypothetical protein